MSQKPSTSHGGVGFMGALGLMFIGLKLGGIIDWSWWYVTLPLWIAPAVVGVFIAFCLLMAGLQKLFFK